MLQIKCAVVFFIFTLLLGCGADSSGSLSASNHAVQQAYAQQLSKRWLTASGAVQRLLPDDNKGSRHQRFVLRIDPQLTVLVAHNIDLAPRVPVQVGSLIKLRGRYEWNNKGGVIHWTHHDPKGRRVGGWVEVDGQRYR